MRGSRPLALWRRIELGRAAAASIGLAALGAGVTSIWLAPSFSLTLGVALMLIAAMVRAQRRGHTSGLILTFGTLGFVRR